MLEEYIKQILVDKALGINNKRLLNKKMPNHLKEILSEYSGEPLHIYGRHSMKNNDSFVPWVALMIEKNTKTVRKHMYVVFLFSKDGTKVSLSLNLGVTHLKEQKRIHLGRNITHKNFLYTCAQTLLASIEVPPDFTVGTLNLGVPSQSESVGKYYQYSNILTKEYSVGAIPSEEEILRDVLVLLQKCEKLNHKFPNYDRFVNDVIMEFKSKDRPTI